MKISSIATRIPSLKLTNEQILTEIAVHNDHLPKEVVDRYQRELSYLLTICGANTRYLRDRSKGETAIGLLKNAMIEALTIADMERADIDLLIFCGVGKGFLEPANAYFFAKTLGMRCQCFDVADACMSWVRSLEIAYHYLIHANYKNVMIINAEFTAFEYGHPEVFKIKSPNQLTYMFPAYTIGEGATATILTNSKDEWRFDFESAPEMANLCTIPLNGYEDFCDKDEYIGLNGVNGFVSISKELFEIAMDKMTDLILSKVKDISEPDLWFPHAATAKPYWQIAESLKIEPSKLYNKAFPAFGNLISASIPVAMQLAIAENRLTRGNKVVLCPASAGMSFGVVQFVY